MANQTRINGEIFNTTSDEDTESILNRYAYYKDTLPKYLFLKEKFKTGQDNIVFNLLDILQKDDKPYTKFYEVYKYIYPTENRDETKTNILSVNEILELWIVYSESLQELPKEYIDDFCTMIVQQINEIHNKNLDSEYIKNLLNNREKVKVKITRDIENFKKQFKSKKSLDSITPISFTHMDIQFVSISCKLNILDLTLSEVFNDIVLNSDIPFVYFKKFFKILKKFKVDETWYQESERDEIVLYVKDKISEESYNTVSIDENFNTKFELNTKKGYVTKEQFIHKIIKVLNNKNIVIEHVIEEKVSAFYEYENMKLNSYIFADLVLNDEIFSKYISIDESIKATKKITSSGEQWIYIHYNDERKDSHVTAGITQKVPDDLHEQPYLRINCKAKDKDNIEKFQIRLGRFLTLYNEKKDNIIKQYKEYVKDFIDEEKYERKISRKRTEKDDFIIPRQCQSHNNLTKISKDDYEKYISKGIDTIKFPNVGENAQYFICENKGGKFSEHIYTGLQVNKQENKEKYPFTPCCFKKSQKDDPIYRHYYEGEELKEKESKQQNIISTNKFARYLNFAELPEMLNNFFENFDPLSEYTYYRIGVDRNENSFLACLLTAILDNQYGVKNENAIKFNKQKFETDRNKILLQLRKDFSKDTGLYPLSKQCTYNMTINELIKDISDEKSYFNPKRYIQMFEEYFQVNIILFNREGITTPYYSHNYYYNFKHENFIFIYEHMGSQTDRASYPQCELITRIRKKPEETLYIFNNNSDIVKKAKDIFSDITKSYVVSSENIFTKKYFIDKGIVPISQLIDGYGKTRQVNVEYKNSQVTIYTNPLCPLNVPIENDLKFPTSSEIANRIFQKLDMNVISNTNHKVSAEYKNNTFTILKNEEKMDSNLRLYNNNKKLARYISEYTLWHFSNYIEEQKIENIVGETLKNFTEKTFKIIKNYNYKDINRIFSKNSSIFKDGKLIITSEEMGKRLMYLLQLKLQQQYFKTISYNKNKTIPNFYIDLTDFDTYQNQIILQGEDCLYKWNNSLDPKTYLYKEIIPESKTPYFFKNSIINDTIYLAQNTDNIETAINICLTWENYKYNIGYYGESKLSVSEYSYTLYSYGNENDIVKYYIKGVNRTNMEIVGYKIDEKCFFTSLLKIIYI